MPGCSKVIHENQMSLVVAGGQDSTGNKLKSVEIIAIDIENRSTPLTWTVLGAVYISGQLGLSFSYVVVDFLPGCSVLGLKSIVLPKWPIN